MLGKLFSYIATPLGLGVGTSNLAYNPARRLPNIGVDNVKYNVQRQLAATAPAFFKPAQDVPTIPIEGNGLALQGQLAMQALQEATDPNNKDAGK